MGSKFCRNHVSPLAQALTLGNCKSESGAAQVVSGSGYLAQVIFHNGEIKSCARHLCFELLNLSRSAGVCFANHWDDVHLHIVIIILVSKIVKGPERLESSEGTLNLDSLWPCCV